MNTINGIRTETIIIDIEDLEFLISRSAYTQNLPPEELQRATDTALRVLARQFNEMPQSQHQHSAVLLLDMMPLETILGAEGFREGLMSWFAGATAADAHSQRKLYALFGRPVFEFYVMPGIDASAMNQRLRDLSPEANIPIVVNTMDEALDLAEKNLRLAHRLEH